ncbi:MAG: hypothetical protein ACXVA0_24435, partial [Mucilaginibacter sp.]
YRLCFCPDPTFGKVKSAECSGRCSFCLPKWQAGCDSRGRHRKDKVRDGEGGDTTSIPDGGTTS